MEQQLQSTYNITDELLSSIRHLNGYESFAKSLKRDGIDFVRLLESKYRLFGLTDNEKQFIQIVNRFGVRAFLEGVRLVKNAYQRTVRAKKRIEYMLEHFERCYFITLTISDEYINEPFSRLALKAKRVCKALSTVWMCNDDEGDMNDRLHFHAVISDDRGDINNLKILWDYGFVKVKPIFVSDKSKRLIARYVTKLARHAVKKTAGKNWYSRLS